jgi:pSer/pThr/pTyr-binding forkhead associated (FHA) protein
MQVILKPVTHPELGEIIVNDSLFAIGRHEEPFTGYAPELVAKLSRRHARIFEQDGVVYLTDLGSLNGTSVNGQPVAALPVRLQRGDRICFTDLCYQIEILGASARGQAPQTAAAPLQLILLPEKQKLTLEPIVVTRFPFLVNKASDVFARYNDTLPEEVSYISRRHAHLFRRGRDLYVEDLGSTNGTFVNGERLEEHARQLQDGDVIAFGGDNFVYRAQLLYAGEEPQDERKRDVSKLLTATAAGRGEDATRTTFVTSATSFLDIYCIDEASSDDEAGARGGQVDTDGTDRGRASGRWRRAVGRPLSLLREIRGEPDARGSARRYYWLAAMLAAAVVGAWLYLDGAPRREIQALLDGGDYRAAVTRANAFLAGRPRDREVSALATEALLKAVVPEWQRALEAGDFAAAGQRLEQGMQLAANGDDRSLLETLQWVTRLEQFIDGRGGADAPVVMFGEEDMMRELVDWWDSDSAAHRRALGAVDRHVPAFAGLRAQVFSHMRALESQAALSLAAIDQFTEALRKSLDSGDAAAPAALLGEFEKKYPRIRGVDALRADLQAYERIDAELRAGRPVEARRRVAETRFATPLFTAHVERLTQRELPTTEVVRRYYQADDDWRDGETQEALAALQILRSERWGEEAERRLQHYRKILEDFERLREARGQPDYEHRLLAFFRALDPQRDRWFVDALADEFRVHSDRAMAEAERDYTAARSAWSRYREAGGIRPLHRLEDGVSTSYRELADLLQDAYTHSAEGLEILDLLQAGHADGWDALHASILSEIRLQRQSLRELAMVLEPSLKQAKLDLLPDVKAGQP